MVLQINLVVAIKGKKICQYPAILTEQIWSIKDLLSGQELLSCGTNVGNPERAKWAHLALSGGQQNIEFPSYCPLVNSAV